MKSSKIDASCVGRTDTRPAQTAQNQPTYGTTDTPPCPEPHDVRNYGHPTLPRTNPRTTAAQRVCRLVAREIRSPSLPISTQPSSKIEHQHAAAANPSHLSVSDTAPGARGCTRRARGALSSRSTHERSRQGLGHVADAIEVEERVGAVALHGHDVQVATKVARVPARNGEAVPEPGQR